MPQNLTQSAKTKSNQGLLASGPDPYGQRPNSQPEPNQIRAGFVCSMVQAVCGRMQPSLKVGN